ncbi:MAG: cation transporter [Hyphomicrobium sp.]|nr:cation transporter [Hyphomicrobium sp.]
MSPVLIGAGNLHDAGKPHGRAAAPMPPDDAARERRLLLVSAAITFATAVAGVSVGLLAASSAIVFDGMYAAVDAGMAVAAWLVARLIGRGEDHRFQFGYWHLEPMLVFLSGALGILALTYAAVDAVGAVLAGGRAVAFGLAVAFNLAGAVISFAAFLYIRRKGKGLNSTLLSLEAQSWLHSGIMNAALGAAFWLAALLEAEGRRDLAVYVDPVILLVLAAALLPHPVRRLLGAGREILQIAPPELDARVQSLARELARQHSFADQRSHVTRVGRAQFVEICFVAPSGRATTTFGQLDLVRRQVAEAVEGFAPSCWLTVEFTADRRWL